MTKNFLLFFFMVLAACAGGGKKTDTSFDGKKIPKDENSYYYYLSSELQHGKEADVLLDLAIKKDRDSSFLWTKKADHHANKAEIEQALNDAKTSLEKDPQNFDALLLLGKLHAAKKDSKTALSYYRRALALNRESEELYNLMAREYLEIRDEGMAFKILNTCTNEISEAMGCMYYIATIHLSRENYDESLKYFSMIYQLNPENPKLLQTMGDIHVKKKKYSRALEIFAQLKQMEPEDMSHTIRSGLIYFEMKDFDKAIMEFEFVLKKYPDSDRINYFMGVLHADKKQYDKAFGFYDKIGEESLFFFEALNRQIYILREQDKISEAVDLLEKKIEKKSDSPDIVGLKVSLLLHAENYKRALAVISQGVSRFKEDDRLLFQRAVIHDKLGQWNQAKQDLHTLIQMNPESERAYNYLGYTMLERGENIDEAIDHISKAMALKPNDGHIIDSLGWGYFKKGDYEKALGLLLKAYQYQPEEPAILEHLGDVYFAMKNKRAARSYYEKALNLLNKISKKTDEDRKILKSVEDKLAKF